MTAFILEEVLPVVLGLVALVALYWVTLDLQKRRQEKERADEEHLQG